MCLKSGQWMKRKPCNFRGLLSEEEVSSLSFLLSDEYSAIDRMFVSSLIPMLNPHFFFVCLFESECTSTGGGEGQREKESDNSEQASS